MQTVLVALCRENQLPAIYTNLLLLLFIGAPSDSLLLRCLQLIQNRLLCLMQHKSYAPLTQLRCYRTEEMIAELLTKSLRRPQFQKMRLKLGVTKLI